MGEAKRRKALEYRITRHTYQKDSAEELVGSALQNIADILNCAIFIKEPEDALLDWPTDSIIGQTTEITKARECPGIKDIREKQTPCLHWELLITDTFLGAVYAIDAMKRGLPFPGPEKIAPLARKWFKTDMPIPGGWKGVIPTIAAVMTTMTPKDTRAN